MANMTCCGVDVGFNGNLSESPGPIKRTSALLVSSLLTVNTIVTTSADDIFCIFYVIL